MHSIFIVDDHPVIRFGMRKVLEDAGYQIAGETDNGADAIQMVRETNPDLLLLDIQMPRLDGLELLARLRTMNQHVRTLILTVQPPEHFTRRCISQGASGFVSKKEDPTELLSAIKAILSGYNYFPREVMAVATCGNDHAKEMTLFKLVNDRELMVLQLFAQGRTNHEIAESMFLSNKTVSTYKKRLMHKLQIDSAIDLIELAKRHGLV
jgi:two-component system response regulator EvgA